MKIDKRFIKFHEIENNAYYLLPFDDELHIATESFLTFEKRFLFFKWKKKLTQGFKLLQLTGPITLLFDAILNANVDKVDEDFPDMTTYKKVDNVELRKKIECIYKDNLDPQIRLIKEACERWKDDLILNNKVLSDEEIDNIIKTNVQRLQQNIMSIKTHNIFNSLSFKLKTGENNIIKKMLDSNMEFLYSQKIGANYKIYYLYDLDIFGTLTIYKVQTVKDVVKTIETFIYNREIIQELTACMANKRL
jgi:hypothetical protein